MNSSSSSSPHRLGIAVLWERPLVGLALLTLLGTVLRMWNLGAKPLWTDEAITYWISQGNISRILSQNAYYNSAPPTYVLVLSLITRWSDSEVAMRSLSLVGGILSIPAMFLLARALLPIRAALFATLLVAITTQQVHYSQELREYSWAFVLSCLMLTAYVHADRSPSTRNAVLLALACVSGIATQYGLIVLLVALNGVYVLRWIKRQTHLAPGMWAGVQAPCLAMALLVYKVSAKEQMRPNAFGNVWAKFYMGNAYWDKRLPSLPVFIASRSVGVWKFAVSVPGMIFPLLGLIALVLLLRRSRGATPAVADKEEISNANLSLLLWGVATGLTALLAVVHKYPYLNGRQMMFLTPTIFLLCGWAFVWIEKSRMRRVGVAAALLWVLVCFVPTAHFLRYEEVGEPTREFIQLLHAERKPGERLWIMENIRPSYTYYERQFDPLVHMDTRPEIYGYPVPSPAENAAQVRAGLVTGCGRMLLMRSLQDELKIPGPVWLWAPAALQRDLKLWVAQVRALRPHVRLVHQYSDLGFLFKAD